MRSVEQLLTAWRYEIRWKPTAKEVVHRAIHKFIFMHCCWTCKKIMLDVNKTSIRSKSGPQPADIFGI